MNFNRLKTHLLVGISLAALFAGLAGTPAQAQDLAPVVDEGLTPETNTIGLDAVGCTRINNAPTNLAYEQRVVELINLERAKVNVPPIKRNSELDFAARDHARDMAEDDYFDHNTYDRVDGVLTLVCGTFVRIRLYYNNYSAAGETLALGYASPEDAVAGWMNSPGHKAIILDPKYNEIGSGYHRGGPQSTNYWALDFGSKSTVFPVIINNEAQKTTNPTVSNYIYGKGVWAEMRLQADNNSWSAWIPFQETINYQLPATNGIHTLSVEFRTSGSAGAAAASSDSIELSVIPVPPGNNKIFLPFVRR